MPQLRQKLRGTSEVFRGGHDRVLLPRGAHHTGEKSVVTAGVGAQCSIERDHPVAWMHTDPQLLLGCPSLFVAVEEMNARAGVGATAADRRLRRARSSPLRRRRETGNRGGVAGPYA